MIKFVRKMDKFDKIHASIKTGVDYFIYYINNDIVKISTRTKRNIGIKTKDPLTLSQFKTRIVEQDIPVFVNQLYKWILGDTSKIIQIRIIDKNKHIRAIQIKGHLRTDEKGNVIYIFGAYVDLSHLGN